MGFIKSKVNNDNSRVVPSFKPFTHSSIYFSPFSTSVSLDSKRYFVTLYILLYDQIVDPKHPEINDKFHLTLV